MDILSLIFTIIGAVAAVLAAYFSYKSMPKNIDNVDLKVKEVKNIGNNVWEVTFAFYNLDEKIVLNDYVIGIYEIDDIEYIINKGISFSGLKLNKSEDFVTLTGDKLRPRSFHTFKVKIKGQRGCYNITWVARGANFSERIDEIKVDLN